MINSFLDSKGINVELYKREVQNQRTIDEHYEWIKEKEFKGVITLKQKDKQMYLGKAVEDSSHYLYVKKGTISKSDLDKKIIANEEEFYIKYIDVKLGNFPNSVNHTRIFVGRDNND